MAQFKKGPIEGVTLIPVRKYVDERGWLAEVFRHDEMKQPYYPVMGYTSVSNPGVTRGPHEHVDQSDLFVFLGPGNFKICLWDNRRNSPTFNNRVVAFGGQDYPLQVLIPPGVVHAYRNVSDTMSVVLNFPNQLFMGEGKKHPIDEIRHEDDPNTPFRLD